MSKTRIEACIRKLSNKLPDRVTVNDEVEVVESKFFGTYNYRFVFHMKYDFSKIQDLRDLAAECRHMNDFYRRPYGLYFYTNYPSDFRDFMVKLTNKYPERSIDISTISYNMNTVGPDDVVQGSLPFNQFRYCAHIRWGEFKSHPNLDRQSLVNFCHTHKDKVICNKVLSASMRGPYMNEYAYLYVLDKKMLNMVKMMFGEHISRIVRYVTIDELRSKKS